MDNVTYFLIGLVVYGAGPCAIAYMVFRLLGEKQEEPKAKVRYVQYRDEGHIHSGKWARP